MTFGNVTLEDYNEMSEKDFEFKEVHQPYLSGERSVHPAIHVGMPKWSCSRWIGDLYPRTVKEKEHLAYYAQRFDTIELNATHYKVYSPELIQKWVQAASTNPNFKFCPKFYQGITHRGVKLIKPELIAEFLKGINEFNGKMGTSFIQVNDKYSRLQQDNVWHFLEYLPSSLPKFFEARHLSWFASTAVMNDVAKRLHQLKAGWVITDVPGARYLNHQVLTIPSTFIRFNCFGNHSLDYFRLEQWRKRLAEWLEAGLQECWFMVHAHDETAALSFAYKAQEEFKRLAGTHV